MTAVSALRHSPRLRCAEIGIEPSLILGINGFDAKQVVQDHNSPVRCVSQCSSPHRAGPSNKNQAVLNEAVPSTAHPAHCQELSSYWTHIEHLCGCERRVTVCRRNQDPCQPVRHPDFCPIAKVAPSARFALNSKANSIPRRQVCLPFHSPITGKQDTPCVTLQSLQ
jgi:hypothetical protein